MTTLRLHRHPATPGVRTFVRHHAALCYLLLTFTISWGGMLVAVSPGGFPAAKAEFDALLPVAVIAMVLGPSISGVVLTALADGTGGLRNLRSRLVRWRVHVGWYAFALLVAPVVALTVIVGLSAIAPAYRPGVLTVDDKPAYITLGITICFLAGIFEEIGWTGFLVPRLTARRGTVYAGLVVGSVWSAWHLLANVWALGTGFTGAVPAPVFLTLGLVSTLLVYRVLMVWVYDRTRSLLVAILMHASLTASVRILDPITTGVPLLVYDLSVAVALWLVVAIVLALTRRARLPR